MLSKIAVRRGTAAQWSITDPVLLSGEIGLETDTRNKKTGNGIAAWNDLPYDTVYSAYIADASAPGRTLLTAQTIAAQKAALQIPDVIAGTIFSDTPPPAPQLEGTIWVDTTTFHFYQWYTDTWIEVEGADIPTAGNGGGGSSTLLSDLTVAGTTVGGVTSGRTFAAGTSLEDILRAILIVAVTPTYTQPALNLNCSLSFIKEIGTSLTPVWTPYWAQNDAGALTAYRLKKAGSTIYSNTSATAFTETAFQLTANVSYTAEADYRSGVLKLTNLGAPWPTGQIAAGTKTSGTVTFVAARQMFYGTDTSTSTPNTSSQVRAFTPYVNPTNGTSFTINIPVGATRVAIAYPASLQNVTQIKYVEGLNADVKGAFNLSTVAVEGANGYTPITYKVYTYVPVGAFGNVATYNVTI